MKKIASIQPKGVAAIVVYVVEKTNHNPYKLYLEWNELGSYGITKRRKKITEYQNLSSCAEQMMYYARQHDEEGR